MSVDVRDKCKIVSIQAKLYSEARQEWKYNSDTPTLSSTSASNVLYFSIFVGNKPEQDGIQFYCRASSCCPSKKHIRVAKNEERASNRHLYNILKLLRHKKSDSANILPTAKTIGCILNMDTTETGTR